MQQEFTLACTRGDIRTAASLINKVDPSFQHNITIQAASGDGRLEVVRLLLTDPRVDPSDCNNYAIRWASENGHLEVVRLLLTDPRVDLSNDNNHAIRMARKNGHTKVVQLLTEHQFRLDGPEYNKNIL